ncbi:hypothetical protein D3C76_430840 [compost metagenome]
MTAWNRHDNRLGVALKRRGIVGEAGQPMSTAAAIFYYLVGIQTPSAPYPLGAFTCPSLCELRQLAGGMPNCAMNQRVNELAIE